MLFLRSYRVSYVGLGEHSHSHYIGTKPRCRENDFFRQRRCSPTPTPKESGPPYLKVLVLHRSNGGSRDIT